MPRPVVRSVLAVAAALTRLVTRPVRAGWRWACANLAVRYYVALVAIITGPLALYLAVATDSVVGPYLLFVINALSVATGIRRVRPATRKAP